MQKLAKVILWVGLGLFSLGLLLFIYLGLYNRFWADDWCYNADLITLGFWGTLKGYSFITHYASNRYSLTIFTLLMQYLGVFGTQLMAFFVVTFWFGGLFLVFKGLNQFFKLQLNRPALALAVLVIEYYSLYLAPNQFQILHFRSATLTYSAPLIFSLYLWGLLLWQMNHESQPRRLPVLIGLLAFFAGGFSEGGCAFLGASLGLFWLAVLFFRQKGRPWAKRLFFPATVALLGVILALVVLVLSPAIEARRVGNYHQPTSPLLVPFLALTFTFDFIQASLRGLIVPHLALAGLSFLLPFLTSLAGLPLLEFSLSKSLKASLVLILVAILLIAASQIPTTYIEKGPPAPRGLLFARFTLTLALAAFFWLWGIYLAPRLDRSAVTILALFILLPLAYTLRPILATYADLPHYVERAKIWDERDAAIRAAQAQGILQIDVRGIDGAAVGNILDLKEKPTFWTNSCAASYYGMDEIRATKP